MEKAQDRKIQKLHTKKKQRMHKETKEWISERRGIKWHKNKNDEQGDMKQTGCVWQK